MIKLRLIISTRMYLNLYLNQIEPKKFHEDGDTLDLKDQIKSEY
jgi:hypothetical protein